jgi:hypothetical protein
MDLFTTCFHELEKLAALDKKETELWRQVAREQAKFDAMSAGGKMTDAQREKHLHNTERLRILQEKKTGKRGDIPRWVKDPRGVPPEASFRARGGTPPGAGPAQPYYGRIPRWAQPFVKTRGRVYGTLAGLGFLTGAATGALGRAMETSAGRRSREAYEKRYGGPITRFGGKHPAVHSGLLEAAAFPLFASQLHRGFVPALAISTAPAVGSILVDRVIRAVEDARKKKVREAKVRESKEAA